MKAALYLRVSTLDQNPESQLHDLLQLAQQRGWQVVGRYVDHGISGTRTRRPGLDQLMADAHRGKFDVVVCWACDRMARSVRHFLEVLDELRHVNVAFVSYREQIDTAGSLGRAIMVIVGAIAELERSLIIERVRAGIRRAKLEGRHIGRNPIEVDIPALRRDRARGMSLREIAKAHRIGKTTVARLLKEHASGVPQGAPQTSLQTVESTTRIKPHNTVLNLRLKGHFFGVSKNLSSLTASLREKVFDAAGYLLSMCFEGEMPCVQQIRLHILQIAGVRRRAFRREDVIVLAPYNKSRWVIFSKEGLEFRVERDICPIVVEQIQLNFCVPRSI